jgi:hypothetical protein
MVKIARDPAAYQRIEALVSNAISAGGPLWGNYPPGEETIAEYKAHKEQERING